MSLSEKSDPERVHGCIDARTDILWSPQGFLPATRVSAEQNLILALLNDQPRHLCGQVR